MVSASRDAVKINYPDNLQPAPFMLRPKEEFSKPIRRLGLASHGNTGITVDDIHYSIPCGVNFLNWTAYAEGQPDDWVFPEAVAELGSHRDHVAVCIQFAAQTAAEAAKELRSVLSAVHSDYIDVVTIYYVERDEEWKALSAPGGVLDYLQAAKRDGTVRRIGITSHQRQLAAAIAQSGLIDCLMIRYNAAHRGAERDIFPVTSSLELPVISYTGKRWGALLRPTPDDPSGFVVPPAPSWYRFALQSPAVSVVLSAPHSRAELEEDLSVLKVTGPLPTEEYDALAAHGERVRTHSKAFP